MPNLITPTLITFFGRLFNQKSTPFIVLLALFFSACQLNNKNGNTDDSKALYADYLTAFTSGVISKADPIKLKLTKDWGDSLAGKDIPDKFFAFSPAINGKASWQDNRTIIFSPAENLKSGQEYSVIADLQLLFPEIEKDRQKFRFSFQTRVQNFEVSTGGIQLYDNADLTRVKLVGQIQTADVADFEDIKKTISATQGEYTLTINWTASGHNTYSFVIEDVKRTDNPEVVILALNGSPIGVIKKEIQEIEVPSLTDYKVVSVKIVSRQDSYISVLFSDPLDEKQNLRGLVKFRDIGRLPRLVVNLNELKIYPGQQIQGNAEIMISSGVKSINGSRLKEDFTANVQFTQVKPQVKFVNGDNKSILPGTSGLVLPFDAVGLKAVDVIVVKIFTNNIIQYLQENDLGADYRLNQVGKPIIRKTIPLDAIGVTSLSSWNRFTLDLNEILTTEPGAIYQITIGFQKRHSLYSCETSEAKETEIIADNWGPEDDDSYWDSYESYYAPGFNWEDRDDPCTVSYYGRQKSISKILFASDLGIIVKKRDGGKIYAYVTSLLDTEPLEGVDIEIYDYQQQSLGFVTTDIDGKAEIDVNDEPFVLIARKGDQTGYLKLNDGSSLSLSNFDIAGTRVRNGLKGFIYGERGVWRPADTVHLAFILQDVAGDLPTKHPVIMEFYNPLGQLADRKVSATPVGNIYRFDFITNAESPTGNWQAKAKVGGSGFTKTIKVETIKPNRLKVNLEFDKEKFTANDNTISGNLNVRWLTGAKAGNLKAEYELLLSPAKTVFDGFPTFTFDDAAKEFYSERTIVFSGKVNTDGYARLNFDLGDATNAPGALNAKLYGKVYEQGGDFSISNVTIPYYPYTSFVGLKLPEGDKRGMLLTDEDHKVKVATVDADGNPVSIRGVKVKLYKLDWRWWWDNSYDYISNYVSTSYSSPVSSGTINTNNGVGEWTLRINYPEWGRYYVQVIDPVSGHSAGQVVYLDWPGWAGKAKRGDIDGASMLDFSTDKKEYNVGDEVSISVPTTAGNRILVSLETGSEVLNSFWVKTKTDNTKINFTTTADMAPNIYVHLSMIQPHGQKNNDLPIRLYGIQSVKVLNPQTVLTPVIKMPQKLRPEETFTIAVTEKDGRAMAYTLAMVDEGLLDITNYKTPDPWSVFFAREALGIKTWDIYDDVMGAYAGKLEHLLAIGGDGELEAKEQKEANRFKPVVKYLGPFYLKAGETRKHKLQMPQYVGSVKTMVIAATKEAFGSTDVVTPVKQPLMLLATLPRVAGPGETMKLPVNIFTVDDEIKSIALTVETNVGFKILGSKTKTIKFTKAGDKIVFFDLQTKAALGTGKVKVTAKAGNLSAVYDVELNIIPRNPEITAVNDKVIDAGAKWQLTYQPLGIAGMNAGAVEVSTMPSLNIEQRLNYLIRYPHGCIEQTTSAVFAQLFINDLTTIPTDKQAKIETNIKAGIDRIKSFQVESGGFSYWPGNNYANNWGTNYAGHFLIEAKKAGYVVADNIFSNWLRYQTRRARNWGNNNSDNNNDLIQAYRLYTLALADKPAMGAMNRMKENTGISRKAKWRLALAYAVAGYDKQATKLIEGLSEDVEESPEDYRYTFGSSTRDKAMILETLLELNKKDQAFTLLMEIAKDMGNQNRWLSTQTTAYCFIAIAKYADKFKLDEETDVNIIIAGNIENIAGSDFINLINVKKADQETKIEVTNNGQAPVFARIIRTGTPIEGNEKTISRNISFSIQYFDVNGNKLNVAKLNQGTNFKAKVTISNPGQRGQYTELALTQIFPSGWEIINTRLDGSASENTGAKYMDIKDDRVMHYFDLGPNQKISFTVLLNASYQGKYYLPSISVGAMYDNTIFANKPGRWVEVIGEGQ